MPTIMQIGPYRFFFYANENDEPRHVHIRNAENEAKYWLEPVELAYNYGYNSRELKRIEQHINDNMAYLIEVWDTFFGEQDEE